MKGPSHKRQQGFNLIELMIVVAIIGILASTAGGMYTTYIVRIQVMEGFVLSAAVRTQMMEYHNENGAWPNNNNLASLANQNTIDGQFVKSVALNKHRVEIQYGEDAHSAIWGKKIQLVPTVQNGVFKWGCEVTGGGVDEKYLPDMCEGSTTSDNDNNNNNNNNGGGDNGNGKGKNK